MLDVVEVLIHAEVTSLRSGYGSDIEKSRPARIHICIVLDGVVEVGLIAGAA